MTQTSWRQSALLHSLHFLTNLVNWRAVWRSLNRWQGLGGGLIAGSLLVALWIWSWQFVVSAIASTGSMVLIYQLQQRQWQRFWQNLDRLWQRLWSRSNRQLSLTIAGGSLIGVSTYMATAVWLESSSRALAIGTVLQGLGTLAILLLMLGQPRARLVTADQTDALLDRLADPNPLKRLVAVRQALRSVDQGTASLGLTQSDLADCLRLMLDRETEPTLQTTLTEALQHLNPGLRLEATTAPPLSMPLQTDLRVQELQDAEKG